MKNSFAGALKCFALLTLITGVIYPLTVTGLASLFFKAKAEGSLIKSDGQVVGSRLIAQKFSQDRYFWARPSASDYGALPSGASNLGPTSKALKDLIEERRAQGLTGEMLFASGSGLDPHIPVDAALSQVARIVRARNLGENEAAAIRLSIAKNTEERDFGVFGQKRVNVLLLNLALDGRKIE